MTGLNLYSGDDFKIEVQRGDNWLELFATAWEEAGEAAPVTQVTAMNKRSGSITGTRPVESITVGMEAVNLSSPTFNWVSKQSTPLRWRVTTPQDVLRPVSDGTDTLGFAQDGEPTAGSSFFGGSTATTGWTAFYEDADYAEGVIVKAGTKFLLLEKKADTAAASLFREIAAGGSFAKAAYPNATLNASVYSIIKPGVSRGGTNGLLATVTLGGAVTLRTGEQAASSIELQPTSALPDLTVWGLT